MYVCVCVCEREREREREGEGDLHLSFFSDHLVPISSSQLHPLLW